MPPKKKCASAERTRKYRDAMKSNLERLEAARKKNLERWNARNAAGKNKHIADLTERGKRFRRKALCQSQSKSRDRRRVIAQLEKDAQDILSPCHVQAPVEVNPHDLAASTQKQRCRKKVKKNRSKACRTVYKLQIALKRETTKTARYKKRLQRLIVKISPDIPSPVKKKSVLLGNVKTGHKSWKRVLFYQVLVSELKKVSCGRQ